MKSKLFNKFFFSISAIIIVSFTIIFATISFVVSHYFSNEKYSLLDESCNSVSRIVSVEFNSSSFNKNIYYILRSQKDVSNSDIFICDKNGNIIICCCDEFLQNKKCFHTNTVINKEIINTVKAKGIKEISTLNNLYDDKYYCVGKPIIGTDGEIKGYTFASASTKSLKNLLVTIRKMSLVACLVPIVITFFVLFSLTYRFSKPLKSMSEAAKRISFNFSISANYRLTYAIIFIIIKVI